MGSYGTLATAPSYSACDLSSASEGAQLRLVEDLLELGLVAWFTPEKMSALHRSVAMAAGKSLVAKLSSLDDSLAEHVASMFS